MAVVYVNLTLDELPKKLQVLFRKKYGPKTRRSDGKLIKIWYEKFKET